MSEDGIKLTGLQKITDTEYEAVSFKRVANRPSAQSRYGNAGMTAEAFKEAVDAPSKFLKEQINDLIDKLCDLGSLGTVLTVGGAEYSISDLIKAITSGTLADLIRVPVGEEYMTLSAFVEEALALHTELSEDKLDKITTAGDNKKVYIVEKNAQGQAEQGSVEISPTAVTGKLPVYNASGCIPTNDPVSNEDSVSLQHLKGHAAVDLSVKMDQSDYKIRISLKDANGRMIGGEKVIDLPLESVVTGATYDKETKKLVLSLVNGQPVEADIGDLITGLVNEDDLTREIEKVNASLTAATHEEVSTNVQLSPLSLPTEQVLDGKILLYRNNTYSDYDSSCNELGATITVNGTEYDISGKCKDDTYEADVTDGTVRWTEKRRKKALSEVSSFEKTEDGAFAFTDADAKAGSAYSSDDSVSVTVDGSTVKLFKDGITDAAAFKVYVKGTENLFSEFEELSSADAGSYKGYAVGSSGTLAKTNTSFVMTSKPIPVSKANGNSVYIRYKSYTPQGVLKDDTYGRICRIRFYSDAAGTVPITTDGTFLSLALTTSNNTVSSMQIPNTAKSVRFTVYISDMIKDKSGNRINHGFAAGGVAWASLFWSSIDISSLEIKDFYVGYSETDSKPVSITYPVSTEATMMTGSFVPMTDVNVSSTVHMLAGYRANRLLKDAFAAYSEQVRVLDKDTAKTVQLVAWDGYVERVYINTNAPDGKGGSYLKIEDAGEGKEGRRLYWKKVGPGEEFGVYSETNEPVVLAAMDKIPEAGYTPAIGNFLVKKNTSVSDDLYHSVSLEMPDVCMYLVLQISSSSSYPASNKADAWYKERFAQTIVSQGEPVGMIREEKYIPKERVESELINDPIQSDGEYFAIRKAKQMSEVRWTPAAANMKTANENENFPVTEQVGLPYSSVKAYNRFIGIDALLETFLTAVKNKNSVLYGDGERSTSIVNYGLGTDSGGYKPIGSALTPISLANENVGPYYGSVCSAFTGYCIGLPSYETTYSISHRASVTKRRGLSAYNCKRGDVLLQQHYHTKGGHVIFVSDVERAKNGEIRYITTEESTIPVVKTERKEPRQFFDDSLSFGRNSKYQQITILEYEELYRNVIREYDVRVLRGITFNGGTVEKLVNEIVLDDTFDKVGCVYYICKNTKTCMLIPEGDAAVDGLHWEFTPAATDAATKDFSMPVLKIIGLSGYSTGKIVVSPLDTMKSMIVPEWAYNYRMDLMLDRGNRSQYRLGESVGIYNATGNQITVSITGAATGSPTVAANSVGTYTPTVAGYYKVTVNGDEKTPLEFFVYNTGTVSVKTDSLSTETITGKIDGAVLTDDDGYVLMKPAYVSLTTEKGIVGTTSAAVSIEGSTVKFSIGKYTIPDAYNIAGHKFNCLRVHFETRHGRVITQPVKLWN